MEFHPVLHEPDVPCHRQGPPDLQIIFLGDDDAFDGLPWFEQRFLDKAHVPLDLADGPVLLPVFSKCWSTQIDTLVIRLPSYPRGVVDSGTVSSITRGP